MTPLHLLGTSEYYFKIAVVDYFLYQNERCHVNALDTSDREMK